MSSASFNSNNEKNDRLTYVQLWLISGTGVCSRNLVWTTPESFSIVRAQNVWGLRRGEDKHREDDPVVTGGESLRI